jgi:hypothetical protein
MEKGYRDYGHDIDNTDSVLEAGLGFAVDLEKASGFIGRDAVLRRKEAGLTRRLLQFRLADPEPQLFHGEPILRDGNAALAAWATDHVGPLARRWGHIAPLLMQATLALQAGRAASSSLADALEELGDRESEAANAFPGPGSPEDLGPRKEGA